MTLRLYFDEDAGQRVAIRPLRAAGIEVTTTAEAGKLGTSDEEQWAFATSRGWVLVSQNVQHFFHLHTRWLSTGRPHNGMILIHQGRLTVGEQIRRLRRICDAVTAEQMRDRVEFLSGWD